MNRARTQYASLGSKWGTSGHHAPVSPAGAAYAARWLTEHPGLLAAMQTKQVLAVCAGLQVLGRWMQGPDGQKGAGAGLLDLTTAPGPRRAIGEIVTDCTHPGVARLTGFENHRGHTNLGPDSPPLGAVIDGVGNGNGTDGVLTATNIGTYLHGPVLARNPDLADLLLHRATGLALTPLHVPGQEEARGLRLHRPSRAHRPSRTARGHQATS